MPGGGDRRRLRFADGEQQHSSAGWSPGRGSATASRRLVPPRRAAGRRVVDGEHLLARGELRRRAAGRISDPAPRRGRSRATSIAIWRRPSGCRRCGRTARGRAGRRSGRHEDERGRQHATYQSVSRPGPFQSSAPSARKSQRISRAAPRVYQLDRVPVVDLAPQALDVDLDQVRHRIEAVVPYVLRDVGAADDLSLPADEIFEQGVFLGRQLDREAGPLDAPARVSTARSRRRGPQMRAPARAGAARGRAPAVPESDTAWGDSRRRRRRVLRRAGRDLRARSASGPARRRLRAKPAAQVQAVVPGSRTSTMTRS